MAITRIGTGPVRRMGGAGNVTVRSETSIAGLISDAASFVSGPRIRVDGASQTWPA